MTKIIFLIILFNVVTAYIKNRAKKKKLEEQRAAAIKVKEGLGGSLGANNSGGRDRVVSTATEETVAKKKEAPVWASQHDADEVTQDWDEHNLSDYGDEESENPYREPSRPNPVVLKQGPTPNSERSQVAEAGKDLLTQLARELGLNIPQRPQPNPVPRPVPNPTPNPVQPAPLSADAQLRNKRATAGYDDQGRTVADSAPGKDMTSAPGIAAVESANAAAYVTRDPLRPTAMTAIRADLFDPESLRRAFILKTILDQPLSLRTQSKGLASVE